MYSLDIETLIGVLQNRQIQGFLEADLATGGISGGLRKGFIVVELRDGKIVSASIRDTSGRVLYQGPDALDKIRQVVFTWKLTETSSLSAERRMHTDPKLPVQRLSSDVQPQTNAGPFLPPVQRQTSLDIGTLIPVRRQDLTAENLRSLTRLARSIYALVNGINSIQRIAGLLALPTNTVYRELQVLQEMQLVAIIENVRRT